MKSFAEQVKISLHKKAKMILRSAALRLQRLQQLQHIVTIVTPLPTVTSRIISKVELLTVSWWACRKVNDVDQVAHIAPGPHYPTPPYIKIRYFIIFNKSTMDEIFA